MAGILGSGVSKLLGGGDTVTKTEQILNPTQQHLSDLGLGKADIYAKQGLKWPTAGGKAAVPAKRYAALTPQQQAHLEALRKIALPGGPNLRPGQVTQLQQLQAEKARAGKIKKPGSPAVPATAIKQVAPINPYQTGGAREAVGEAGTQADIGANAAALQKFLTDPRLLDPSTNPAEAASIKAATQPIFDQLMQTTLPGLRSGAATAGQYGSSRQGIAEGLASTGASRAAGETGAAIANADYQAGLDALAKGLGLSPSVGQMQTQPAATEAGAGDYLQNLQSQQNQAKLARDFYNMGIPASQAGNLFAWASGVPGGGSSTTSTGSTGLIPAALGGASTGAGLATDIFGAGAAPAGAGIGAGTAALYNVLTG